MTICETCGRNHPLLDRFSVVMRSLSKSSISVEVAAICPIAQAIAGSGQRHRPRSLASQSGRVPEEFPRIGWDTAISREEQRQTDSPRVSGGPPAVTPGNSGRA